MNTYRVGTLLFGALAGAAILMTGCSTEATTETTSAALDEGRVASLGFQLVKDPDFTGNSVLICGDRKEDADGKYPCLNHFCKCFDFDKDGKTEKIEDLCPSADVGPAGADKPPPGANWNFTYVVYNGSCKNDYKIPITDPDPKDSYVKNDHNFVCYDKQTPFQYPNQSVNEELKPGKNHNDIICVTKNASKDWNFDVCVDETGYDGKISLDCGCKVNPDPYCKAEDKCMCGENGTAIPTGFFANPEHGCNIERKAD